MYFNFFFLKLGGNQIQVDETYDWGREGFCVSGVMSENGRFLQLSYQRKEEAHKSKYNTIQKLLEIGKYSEKSPLVVNTDKCCLDMVEFQNDDRVCIAQDPNHIICKY